MWIRSLAPAAAALGILFAAPTASAVDGAGLSKKLDRACDANDDGKISEKEFDDKKCQRKVVSVMANFQRELATLGEEGATKLVDAIADEGKGKSKKERREDAMKCLVNAAEKAVALYMGKDDTKGVLEDVAKSDAFKSCYAVIPAKTVDRLSEKLDARIAKVTEARNDLADIVSAMGEDKLDAFLLRVDAKRAKEDAWRKLVRGSLKTGIAVASAYTKKDAKSVVKAAVGFFFLIGNTASNAKEARNLACQSVLRAEELDPSASWRERFVKRCKERETPDPESLQ